MKHILFLLFISITLVGCYTPVKVQNLSTHTIDVVEVEIDFLDQLSYGDTVVFHEENSSLRPSESFVGIVLEGKATASMAITLDNTINPITGDSIPSGTILPCTARAGRNTGDIIYVSPSTGDGYFESSVGIRAVFVK